MIGDLLSVGHRWEDVKHYTLRQLYWFNWAASQNSHERFITSVHSVRLGVKASQMEEQDLRSLVKELSDANS